MLKYRLFAGFFANAKVERRYFRRLPKRWQFSDMVESQTNKVLPHFLIICLRKLNRFSKLKLFVFDHARPLFVHFRSFQKKMKVDLRRI